MLARMFSLEGRLWPAAVDKDGAFLIDRYAVAYGRIMGAPTRTVRIRQAHSNFISNRHLEEGQAVFSDLGYHSLN